MGLPDPKTIGSTRAIQNPQDAIEQATGKYADAVSSMSEEARLPLGSLPKAPEPTPFAIKGAGTGGR